MRKNFNFTDPDGFTIQAYKWTPSSVENVKGVVQIVHGLVEHSLRYEHFAKFLNEHGYIVYSEDHREHGKTKGTHYEFGIKGEAGWIGMVKDLKQMTDIIKNENPGLPVFIFAHSMGSYLAQCYIQNYGNEIKGYVLCGSTRDIGDVDAIIAMAENVIEAQGEKADSPLLKEVFASFNKAIGNNESLDWWTTRDEKVVNSYCDDPMSGTCMNNRFVEILVKGMKYMWLPENEEKIADNVNIFIITGSKDASNGFGQGAKLLYERYKALGLKNVSFKVYPECRHELINEINKDEVMNDIINWYESI